MKRYLPFILIAAVAALTVGGGTMLYRAKQHPPLTIPTAPPQITSDTTATTPGAHLRGAPTAPVTLEIYGDFQCPPCATASAMISDLEHDYGDRMRVIYHHFPLAMHAHAMEAAAAAEAAGLQGHFWEMHDLLYQNQDTWARSVDPKFFFQSSAIKLGLDIERFKKDSESEEVIARVKAERDEGEKRGIKSTPTLFINGQEVKPFPPEHLREVVAAAVNARKDS